MLTENEKYLNKKDGLDIQKDSLFKGYAIGNRLPKVKTVTCQFDTNSNVSCLTNRLRILTRYKKKQKALSEYIDIES